MLNIKYIMSFLASLSETALRSNQLKQMRLADKHTMQHMVFWSVLLQATKLLELNDKVESFQLYLLLS